ncbi:MAG: hypothetical protein R3266_13830, partial [Gemmatimonadota bacterium]|nr:hypothetical protein [Gemmatimonadota bacterium]
GERATVLLCGDDEDAKTLVADIAGRAGFGPVDAGPMAVARYTETAAQLMVQLVRHQGLPPADVALHLLRRTEAPNG